MTISSSRVQSLTQIQTSRFGALEVTAERIFRFPECVLGFPGLHEYAVLENESSSPFEWLQCCDEPSLAFVICNPQQFKPDYRIRVKRNDLASIEMQGPEEGRVAVILVIPRQPARMTANLRGPLVFNLKARLAKQVVLLGEEYTTKYRVFPD